MVYLRTWAYLTLSLGVLAQDNSRQLLPSLQGSSGGSWTHLIDSAAAGGLTGGTTTAINTSGAGGVDFIDCQVGYNNGFSPVLNISDSPGNSYTLCGNNGSAFSQATAHYYVHNPLLSTTHTFTLSTGVTSSFSAILCRCFKGSAASPCDTGHNFVGEGTGADTFKLTSITPSQNGALLLITTSSGTHGSFPQTVDSSFISPVIGIDNDGATTDGVGSSYFIQPTAAAIAPTITFNTVANVGANIVSYLHQ